MACTIKFCDRKLRFSLQRSLQSKFTILAKASIRNYDRNHSFIVMATVIAIMIVNNDRKTFIVQATGAIIERCSLCCVQ